MSGIHCEAQHRINDVNSKAIFLTCGIHSPSLAGIHAVGSFELSDVFSRNVPLFVRYASIACRALQKVGEPVEMHLLQWHSALISNAYITCIWICALRATFKKMF